MLANSPPGDTRTRSGEPCRATLTEAPLEVPDAIELARLFGALADPARLRLLSILVAEGEVCSCDLEVPLAKSQPTVSHHTRVLSEVGLIVADRRGCWTWWRVDADRLTDVRRALGRALGAEAVGKGPV